MCGNLVMSYNLIDLNLYEKVDCKVEQHYHRKFGAYQKYRIKIPTLPNTFEIDIDLVMEDNESNDPQYAEIVIHKNCKIQFTNLYNSDPFEKLVKGLDAILNPYYIVDTDGNDILLTAKIKGKVPCIQTPKVVIDLFDVINEHRGQDTEIFVMKPNEIQLPRTTFGKNYNIPKIGDVIYLIDSVDSDRDRTFIRTITDVVKNGPCTCDILTLDLPIDRLNNKNRIDGIGLQRPASISNNYTASFNKTQLWRRRDNFKKLLNTGKPTGLCAKQIGNFMNMIPIVKEIMSQLDHKSFSYFGTHFHWKQFEKLLKPMYDKYGEYLCDDLFVLKSSVDRPDYLIHIDYDEVHKDMPVVGSFTWPVLNCTKDTVTIWYECLENGTKIYKHGKQDVVITDENLVLKEIDRYYFDTEEFNAIILKHDDWHTVYNESKSKEDRMLLQWRFKPHLSWDEICKIVFNTQ